VIAFARDDRDAVVQVFFIRNGKLIGRETFTLENVEGEADTELMQSFIQQFYDQTATVPQAVLLSRDLDEMAIVRQWLKQKRGADVVLRVPREGKQRKLVEMAAANALEALEHLRSHWAVQERRQTEAIDELQQALSLPGHARCREHGRLREGAAPQKRLPQIQNAQPAQ